MTPQEYQKYDALSLAELIKTKQLSPKELLSVAQKVYQQANPKLNAVIHTFFERAEKYASSIDLNTPFAGVPFLLKDLQCEFAGEPLTMGSRGINYIPETDSTLAQRYKQAGLNIFGKTNTPEYGLIITTEPKAHGPTHNPHKSGYSAGGSSGGSAAAVAAGIVPMAHGGDGGGSIRFPAAWCGCFGLKPSRNRTPLGPKVGEDWSGAVVEHAITKSVRDSAALLDVTQGADVASPFIIQQPDRSYLSSIERPLEHLKFVVTNLPLVSTNVTSEIQDAVINTAKKLEDLGHSVEWKDPTINRDQLWRSFIIVVASHVAATEENVKQRFGKHSARMLEPQTKNLAMLGRSFSAKDVIMALNDWQTIRTETNEYLSGYDAMLCPTVPTPAVKHGALLKNPIEEIILTLSSFIKIGKLSYKLGIVEQMARPVLETMAFTILGNVTGLPAMSMPMAMSQDGLPIGVQLYGHFGREDLLLNVAAQLEEFFIHS
ncbi:MAG: amidase [Gammaproteobacteria bacterium]|nr:amidase [Gammaproteobacteria bacterium]